MTQPDMQQPARKLTLIGLTWPIFIELALHMLMNTMDTFMLSQYDDRAVGAVGVSNQINNMVNIMFGFVAAGTTILISRNMGAGRLQNARRIATTSLTMNLLLGVLLSVILLLFGGGMLRLLGLDADLMKYGTTYLGITGSFVFLQALMLTTSAVIKSHGHTRVVMYVTFGMNVLHIFGNGLFLFGWFGIPVLGVTGVAISTVVCRAIGLAVMLYVLVRKLGHPLPFQDLLRPSKESAKEVLGIGVPSAGEQFSYNTSQIVITSFIATIGTAAIVTRIYTFNIIFMITLFSSAIGQGTQILVARMVGSRNYESAYKRCLHSLGIGMLVAFVMAGVFNLCGGYMLRMFTDDPDIVELGQKLLLFAFVLEPGRAFNLIVISSLRSAGDVKFPVLIGICSMWGIAVPSAYLFGIHFGFGLAGIFIAFILDEWLRGLLMLSRWRSKSWLRKLEAADAKTEATTASAVSG